MFVRARPVVNEVKLLECLSQVPASQQPEDVTELYFNSASAALKWLLSALREKAGKPQRVAVQVLTCETVESAIRESGNIPVFMDTSAGELTTLFPIVASQQDIDVLLLSHLYGLANPDYPRISEWCEKRNVVLVNDLAQTVGARVGEQTVESYGDYYLYSFGFDKPISAGSGGLLKVKANDDWLLHKYKELSQIAGGTSKFNLKKFALYYCLTASDIYRGEFRRNTLLENVVISCLDTGLVDKARAKTLYTLLSSAPNKLLSVVERICRGVIGKFSSRGIHVQRLGSFQVAYLCKLRDEHGRITSQYQESLAELVRDRCDFLSGNGFINGYSLGNASCGQRITILHDDRAALIGALRKRDIEAGVFNWPRLLCQESENNRYPNASQVVAKLINLPTWSTEIWKK